MLRALIAAVLIVGSSSPAFAGKPDRGPDVSNGADKSGLFQKRNTGKKQARKGRSVEEEPFCVRPFEYPRQRY